MADADDQCMYNAGINRITAESTPEPIDSDCSDYEQYYTPPESSSLVVASSPVAGSSPSSRLRRPSARLLKRPATALPHIDPYEIPDDGNNNESNNREEEQEEAPAPSPRSRGSRPTGAKVKARRPTAIVP